MENSNIPTNPSDDQSTYPDGYYRSGGGKQFFRRQGGWVEVACLVECNPCWERQRYTHSTFQALAVTACRPEEFDAARRRAIQLISCTPDDNQARHEPTTLAVQAAA